MIRRRATCLLMLLVTLGVLFTAHAVLASAAGFGIKSVSAAESTSAAGLHPDFITKISLVHTSGRVEQVAVALPPGLIGNPNAVLSCTTGQLAAVGNCPIDSQIGVVKPTLEGLGTGTVPLYNLVPPHPSKEIARLGFYVATFPVFIDVSVRTGSDYGITATVHDAPAQEALLSATTTIWGVPAASIHDEQRMTTPEATECNGTACKAPEGKRPSGLVPRPFLDNPTACEPQQVGFTATSYQLPGQVFTAQASMPTTTGCSGLPFDPSLEIEPTSRVAGAPTGLDAVLRIPQNEAPEMPATSAMRDAEVALPEGMTISASAAQGLEGCSPDQVHLGEDVVAACPPASKLGTVTLVSPDLRQPLHGAIYQRTPEPGHLFRIWLVTDELGLHLKIPGDIEPDTHTGQVTTQFRETPQLPVEEIHLHFFGGEQAPLKNPDACGNYAARYDLTPWSGGPSRIGSAPITIDQGCGTGGFSPILTAGVTKATAGSFSPLIAELTRRDREQNIGSFDLTLPKGELAKLSGVPLCPDSAASAGACPTESQIGTVSVAAGAGSNPLWLPQPNKQPTAIYLAGPYQGAPYSVVTVVPAQAGPFDLGTVVVRSGIWIDPETAQVTVKTGPLPQILQGVPILYRSIRLTVDRPRFATTPTNCREMSIRASVTSAGGTAAQPEDRFQVDGCRSLKFRPQFQLSLEGGTKRSAFPALRAAVNAHRGDANIERVSVALPHSEFLAQEHLASICTRVQFAADRCPKRSIYGKARAFTPLLSKPLEGPVYLRSSGDERLLPDLVVALRGQIEIDLVGHIDSKNKGIRTTFESVPDAPITRFVLTMKGGKRGLLENSQDICRHTHRAAVAMTGQNGRARDFGAPLQIQCGQAQRRH